MQLGRHDGCLCNLLLLRFAVAAADAVVAAYLASGYLGLCKVGFKIEGISGCGFRLTCFQGFVGFHAALLDA